MMISLWLVLAAFYVSFVIGFGRISRDIRDIRQQRAIDIRRSVLAEVRTYCQTHEQVRLSDILRIIEQK